MQSAYKKLIPKLLLSLIMLSVTGYLLYNNFVKEKKKFFYMPADMEEESFYSKFNLDFFEDEVFKSLIKSKQIELPTSDKLGRENPFLKF